MFGFVSENVICGNPDNSIFLNMQLYLYFPKYCTVGHKSHDPCFHKKYMQAGVMTLVVHYTFAYFSSFSQFFVKKLKTISYWGCSGLKVKYNNHHGQSKKVTTEFWYFS